MPKSGFCSVCYARVWVAEDGSCANGHAPWAISDVKETAEGSPEAPGGSADGPPTVTVLTPPSAVMAPQAPAEAPEPEPARPEEPIAAPAVAPTTEQPAEQLLRMAKVVLDASTTGASRYLPAKKKSRTLLYVLLGVFMVWCCCPAMCVSVLPDGDGSVENADVPLEASPPAAVMTDTVDIGDVTSPLLPRESSVTATPSASPTASPFATETAAYYVVAYPDAVYPLGEIALGTTAEAGADPDPVGTEPPSVSAEDVVVSFVVPDNVTDDTEFSAELYIGTDGATQDHVMTAGPGHLDPGGALARFARPDDGWKAYETYEIRVLSSGRTLASVFFVLAE